MKSKSKWVAVLIVLYGICGIIQGCISSPNTTVTRSVAPGLYHGIFLDSESGEEDDVYYKLFSNGNFENRQYGVDSIVWFHSKGVVRFENDSVYFSEGKVRVFEEIGQGYWGDWTESENRSYKIDSIYVEIKDDYFELRSEPKVRFTKIGSESSDWPQSKNFLLND